MRTKPRPPKIKRAHGHPVVPIGPAVDARSSQSLKDGVKKREEKEKSLADLKDTSWLVSGVLAYLRDAMDPFSHQSGEALEPSFSAQPKYPKGTPFIFSGAERHSITHPSLGPMRIIKHMWISPNGSKYSISLERLQRDMP